MSATAYQASPQGTATRCRVSLGTLLTHLILTLASLSILPVLWTLPTSFANRRL